jgi:hypothetical protein
MDKVTVTNDKDHKDLVYFSSGQFTLLEDPELGIVNFDKENNPLYVDRKARVFVAGVHRGRPYATADLDEYAKNFPEPKDELRGWKVPLQADHTPRSCQNTIGHPRKLWREGNELFSINRYVGKESVEKVQAGLYGPLSISLDLKNKCVEHIAHTPYPQLDDMEVFDKSEKGDEIMADQKTVDFAEFTKMQEDFARRKADAEKQQAEFAKAQELLATYEKEKAELTDKVQFAADEKFVVISCDFLLVFQVLPIFLENNYPHRILILWGFCRVRKEGFEPSRPFGHWTLNPARLPFHHFRIHWFQRNHSSIKRH